MSDIETSGPMLDFSASMGDEPKKPIKKEVVQDSEESSLNLYANDPKMQAVELEQKTKTEKEQAVKAEYEKKMDNIKRFGPMEGDQEILTEEEQRISDLVEKGDYDSVKAEVRDHLTQAGADYRAFDALDYFESFLASPRPEVREWAVQMSMMTVRLLKAMNKQK